VEAQWLHYAVVRLEAARDEVRAEIAGASLLPELYKARKQEAQDLREAWADAVVGLHDGLSERQGPNAPLIQVLFVHRKLDKLRRECAASADFEREYLRRRNSSYIQRMEKEPTHPFLAPLLAAVDEARQRLEEHAAEPALSEEAADELRRKISQRADTVLLRLQQARCLAEAAFAEEPAQLSDLRLDQKPRRKVSKLTSNGESAEERTN